MRYQQMAYKGKVKCIYIDPPYNTGNKDFTPGLLMAKIRPAAPNENNQKF